MAVVPPSQSQTMNLTEWVLLIALSVLWGGSFFFQGIAVKELPTFTIVIARVGLAAMILTLVLTVIGQRLPSKMEAWRALLIMGLLNNALPFTLFVWGQSHIASGVASILNAATPLFTVVAANFLTDDERMTRLKLIGVIAGLVGVTVLIGSSAWQSLDVNVLAQLACLAAALSYAFAGIWGRRFKTMGITPIATATGQLIASTLLLLPIVFLIDRPWNLPMPSGTTIAALVGLAALSTSLGYVFYFRILATAGATNLLLVTFLIPVSAILLGALFLQEKLEVRHFLGMAIIAFGLAAVDGRLIRKLFTNKSAPLGQSANYIDGDGI